MATSSDESKHEEQTDDSITLEAEDDTLFDNPSGQATGLDDADIIGPTQTNGTPDRKGANRKSKTQVNYSAVHKGSAATSTTAQPKPPTKKDLEKLLEAANLEISLLKEKN